MLVQYYEDQLFVVGIAWGQFRGGYNYQLTSKESKYLYDHFEDTELIKKWVKQHAGDFETVEDFLLEVREKIKPFDDYHNWLDVN